MAPRVKSLADDNLKSKKSVFKQRFPGFKKKATELSVLCGNSVGFICYGPDEKDLHVWPENPKSMEQIVARFTAQSDLKRKKNSCDLDDFPNLEGLSVEELTNHLSCINSHLAGIKQKKVQIVIKRIKGSWDQKNTVSVSGEDRSRVSLSENGTDQKSNPNLVSKDHLLKVSDQNTKLGFGGVFDELGYVVRGSTILVESVSDSKYETLGVASNDRVMGMEAGGEEAEHYPNSFTNDVDVWDFDYSSPLTRYCQTPIADYWGNIHGFVTPTTSMI